MELPPSRRDAVDGKAQCLGVSRGSAGAMLRKLTMPERDLVSLLASSSELQQATANLAWTSVQVNEGSSKWHVDKGNVGLSAIFALGEFSNGRLLQGDTQIGIRYKVYQLDGSIPHATESYTGKRFSIVLFTHAAMDDVDPMQLAYLGLLGIPWLITRASDTPCKAMPEIFEFNNGEGTKAREPWTLCLLYLFAGEHRKASIRHELDQICLSQGV